MYSFSKHILHSEPTELHTCFHKNNVFQRKKPQNNSFEHLKIKHVEHLKNDANFS